MSQDIFVSDALPQTKRVMVKDEDLCLHCGLCAERCPTAAWDMRKFELVIPYAFATVPEAGSRKPEAAGGVAR
jgi:ferredoxin